MMKYGSVCSGIEAATAAWRPLGWKPSFFSEIDAFPRAVLEHHYPEAPLHGDFTTIQDSDYEPIELLVGGTPCQSFSVAGLRKGLDDPRGNLMLGFGALAKRLRPTWLVWENVPGVLSASGGRDFGTFLGMLGQLGYGFAYRVLDAQYFGVAQRRRRVFVVGYLGDWRPPAAVLFERNSLSGHPAPSRETREEVAVAPTVRAGGNSTGGDRPYGTDVDTCDSLQPAPILEPGARTGKSTTDVRAGSGIGSSGDPMFTLQAGKQHGVVARMRGFGDYALDDKASTLNARDAKDAKDLVACVSLRGRNGGATAELGGPISGALRASSGGGDKPHVLAFDTTQITSPTNRNSPQPGDPCHPLAAGAHAPAVAGMAVRRLTPVECERLQGFPDNYTLIPGSTARKVEADYLAYLQRHRPDLSAADAARLSKDGPRYKALGNSMAVPVMRHIGERIQQVEKILKDSQEAA